MTEHETIQFQRGGLIPTSSLHFDIKKLKILPCKVTEIKNFIETYHYSKNINGVKIFLCFKVTYNDDLVGGVLFGSMSTTAWKKFSDDEKKVLELRRFVLLDYLGKNSESRVIGYCLRYIKNTYSEIEIIVSYADPLYNHEGTIYKASNFEYIGLSKKDKGFLDEETGKIYHSRSLRVKYKGEYKPFVKKLRKKLLDGKLLPIDLPQKHCFVYRINKKNI